ncbi:MAG: tetratricopeptide repeat protein [Planctomycetaceae bacterium]
MNPINLDYPRLLDELNELAENLDRNKFSLSWADVNWGIAELWLEHRHYDWSQRHRLALKHYHCALHLYEHTKIILINGLHFQNSIGIVYRSLALTEPDFSLKQAITAYQSALTIFTQLRYPAEWAMVQNNLGIACFTHIEERSTDETNLAFISFNAALHIHTRTDYPDDWARIHHNLGTLYQSQQKPVNQVDFCKKAIEHYTRALTIHPEAKHT